MNDCSCCDADVSRNYGNWLYHKPRGRNHPKDVGTGEGLTGRDVKGDAEPPPPLHQTRELQDTSGGELQEGEQGIDAA